MTTTGQRLNIAQLAPDVYKAMVALDSAARKGLDPTLVELMLTRASQLNHCAWCLDMHTRDARKAGVTEQKLYLLNAWEEARDLDSDKERAALALTEAVTVLTDGFVPDAVYNEAAEHFADAELAQLISVILTINVWNRIAVTSRMAPPVRD
ncbi:MAG: carboxymuconolactone decarboxylase family protein [Rhodococcus sp. (in: high G+C Gram-positive bacteria)]|uniref:carboxymuconolactone decarboxylase family protein n=1 Tax=Rhodococcus sp. TaxID=1831 RepID=UPI00120BA20E|nr:carboxymuconolactone decarboxylase family protein [Rhodococcus sp. (in: high G+C Gram-positive bacteria)]RZL24378.1 MAG: carboxymuconolactone decarboxylase family protein [Rhodococcus sp. (in: high G+C Gram-positive bacteria)]